MKVKILGGSKYEGKRYFVNLSEEKVVFLGIVKEDK